MDTSQDGYGAYAQFYDLTHGDRAPRIARVQSLLTEYAPDCRSVLELACGTGSILAGLDKRYDLTGVDLSPAMLKIARTKLPHAHFVRADMASFRLHKYFDAIFCTFNSMDHLPSFDAWESVFARVSAHLTPGGLFLFDANSPQRLQALADHTTWTTHLADGSHTTSLVRALPEGVFTWRMDHVPVWHGRVDAGHARSQEVLLRAFQPARIVTALQKYFNIIDVQSAPGDPFTNQEAGRMYYICKKP